MTRQEVHVELLVQVDTLNSELVKLAKELDRKPLDEPTMTRIGRALNGDY